ncbi:hypothetical protein JZ751_023898, partial [Albula glossodonta]
MSAANEPKDKYHAVWLIFFILGLGTLLPWNFFMTATMYFTSRLKDPEMEVRANLSGNVTAATGNTRSVLEAKFNNVMTLCAMRMRVMGSLVAILVLFLLTAVMVKVSMSPISFFAITMIKIVCINSFGAVLQGSLFGMAGLLPTSYTTPIMSGQGLAGTFAAFSMICALASGAENPQDSAFGYFITACAVILVAVFSYVLLPKMEFFQHFQEGSESKPASYEDNKLNLLDKETQEGKGNVEHMKEESEKYFIPVSCFLLFNLTDWAGRSLTAVCLWPGKDSKLLPALLGLRVVFIPLFMLCNVQPRSYLPVFFEHDAWFIVFMILFAFSNGYLASLCMCFGPNGNRRSHNGLLPVSGAGPGGGAFVPH